MIGPKCQLCGRQHKLHHPVTHSCPIGQRRRTPEGLAKYEEFHATNVFQRKPMKYRKNGSRKNPAMKELAAQGCCACGKPGVAEIHHVLRRSQGGSNHPNNLLNLCSGCHTQEPFAWHRNLGWFFEEFPHVWEKILVPKGWEKHPQYPWKLIPPPEARNSTLMQMQKAAV